MVRMWFVVAVNVAFAAFAALVSRRILFAAFASALLVTFIVVVSNVKIQAMGMSLHAYDIFFYLNWQTLAFLWQEYPTYLIWAAATLTIAGVLTATVWRLDKARCPYLVSSLTLVAAIAAAAGLTAPVRAQRRPGQVFGPRHPISNFYLSFGETLHVLWTGQFLEAAPRTHLPAFAAMPPCHPTSSSAPTILLIHQESAVPLSFFPDLSYDRGLDSFFTGDDQKMHRLGVETYGGGSWLTDFSLLTGISTRSFGEMRSFLHVFMRDKLKETLPQVFAACGYRNILFFPLDENFIGLGKFYRAVGFESILDRTAQHAPTGRERDSFYYKNLLNLLEQKFKSSGTPLFIYLQTMATHAPYDFKYMPEETVSGGGLGNPADVDEFLRRLAMAKIDWDSFLAALKRRFPDKRFLIFRYGDHQPTVTRDHLHVSRGSIVNSDTAPEGFVTFYAVTELNYSGPPLPDYDSLEIAFLGTVMLEAAAIPLPEAYRERKRLMATCNGRYYRCKQRNEVLSFHRRLINSGIVQEP